MDELTITRDAVEAAARAYITELRNKIGWGVTFDQLTAIEQRNARETATAMLNAAARLVVAAYLEGPFADELKQRADTRAQFSGDGGHEEDACDDEEGYGCHAAAAVATRLRARTMAKAHAIELRAQS